MKQTNCTISGCINEGRYCRIHLKETFTPYAKPKKENDNRKEQNKQYRKEARRFITTHPRCAVCSQPSTEVHHKAGRIGELLLDQTKWLAVCSDCHVKITEDSDWAIRKGYSESRLNKN